jgi:hypothetical protein
MPFNTVLSTANKATLRTEAHAIEAYLLLVPNDVVWQGQVNDTKTSTTYASFLWDTTLQGTYTDAKPGQLLLVTTSASDFTQPVVSSVVRKQAPSATEVFLRETGQNIDDTMYVTIFDTYPITEKLGRIDTTGTFKDYDLAYQNLPIAVSGLQTVYADLSGASTFVQSFAPTLTPVADGDALASILWDVGDGTITVGSTTTQNITVSFPNTSEHRWVYLTVTGTNGVSHTFKFNVFTADRFTASNVVKLDYDTLNVNANLDNGWSGSISAWADFNANTVFDKNRVAVVTRELYDITGTPDNTPVQTNVVLVGELSAETGSAQPDDVHSELIQTNISITGLGTALSNLTANKQNIADEASPSTWGDITNPTPTRVAVLHLAYDTTAFDLLPFESEDFSSYIFTGDALHLIGKTVGENIARMLEAFHGSVAGGLITAQDGTIGLYRNANYMATTDRDALDTIMDWDYDESDYESIDDLSIGYEQASTQALAVGARYDTTGDEITGVFEAKAPAAAYGSGYTTADLPGQILESDSSDADAEAELSQRCANHLRFVNDKWIFSATLASGCWPFVPCVHQWHTHTLPASASPRGRSFDATIRWILNEMNLAFTGESVTPTAAWYVETISTGAGVVSRKVPIVGDQNYYPPPKSPFNLFPDDPLSVYATDTPTGTIAPSIATQEPASNYPPGHNNDSPINGEILNVSMRTGGTVSTTRDSVLGETYIVEVDGDGKVSDGSWSFLYNASTGFDTWTPYDAGSGDPIPGDRAVWTGTGWKSNPGVTDREKLIQINSPVWSSNANITDVYMDLTSSFSPDAGHQYWPTGHVGSSPQLDSGSGADAWTFTYSSTTDRIAIGVDSLNNLGSLEITSLEIFGTGTPPTELSSGTDLGERGDAFYQGYDTSSGASLYPGSNGLLVDGSRPTGIPPYSNAHVYRFFVTGTGSPFSFRFLDSAYSDNDNSILRVAITGPNMGVTA